MTMAKDALQISGSNNYEEIRDRSNDYQTIADIGGSPRFVVADYLEPVNDYLEPVNDYLEPVNDYLEPVNDYLEPVNDYLDPRNEARDPYTAPGPQRGTSNHYQALRFASRARSKRVFIFLVGCLIGCGLFIGGLLIGWMLVGRAGKTTASVSRDWLTTTIPEWISADSHLNEFHRTTIKNNSVEPNNEDLPENECVEHTTDCSATVKYKGLCVSSSTLYCRPESDGWLVWLRRVDASVHFNRTWMEYERGFGNPSGNYWLGLKHLHQITNTSIRYKLRVEMTSWTGRKQWAEYSRFIVGASEVKYRVTVDGFQGNTRHDAFRGNVGKMRISGQYFSTYDADNDGYPESCAHLSGGGGWWFSACGDLRPTALYGARGDKDNPYIYWLAAFDTFRDSLRSVVMKIKPG